MIEFIRKRLINSLKFGLNLLENSSVQDDVTNNTILTRTDVTAILEDRTKANDFSHKNLRGVDLSGLDLRECNFASSNLIRANFSQCDLVDANFAYAVCREAIFTYAHVSRVNFSYAYLREVDFSYADLYRSTLDYADCREAILEFANMHRASLQGIQIDKDSIGSRIVQDYPAEFRRTCERIYRHRLDEEQTQQKIDYFVKTRRRIAEQVYRNLKIAFANNGRYAAASWAYVRERQARRQMHFPSRARLHFPLQYPHEGRFVLGRRMVFYCRHFIAWLLDWTAELTCGYGEKPLRTIALSLIILLLFPFVYAWAGGIHSTAGTMTALDYFNYSLAAFTTLGFSEFEATTAVAQTLTSLEALLGISILALLMFVLGNRISRI